MAATKKRLSIGLTQNDLETLKKLMDLMNESQTGIIKMALHHLFVEKIILPQAEAKRP